MPRNPRYDVLFEPVQIGPVTAPNRFYQTPHASGMGTMKPNSSIALRKVKAEGGWGVVCTEYCSIHPSADETPYAYLSIWDDEDAQMCAAISDAIHAHGSLSGIELWHGGFHSINRGTREIALAPSACSSEYVYPAQVREMDLDDIKKFRRWHRDAALRAQKAGFNIVYVYAGPFATFQLAVMGAEVIKIEAPGKPDQIRLEGFDEALNEQGLGTSYVLHNQGKK